MKNEKVLLDKSRKVWASFRRLMAQGYVDEAIELIEKTKPIKK